MKPLPAAVRRVLGLLRPYQLPLFFLLLVIGRMVLFGDKRIPVVKIFQTYILPFLK